jgi:hypothetical protein
LENEYNPHALKQEVILKHWYQKFLNWQERLESNYHTLKRILETEAQHIETLTYAELQRSAEELSYETSVEGHTYYISLEAINMLKNSDLEICIDISSPELNTKWGIKPSWHFFKTREGRVYY